MLARPIDSPVEGKAVRPPVKGVCYEGKNRGYVHGLRTVLRHLPRRFEMGDDMATVIANPVPDEYREAAQQAADECPVEAIVIE